MKVLRYYEMYFSDNDKMMRAGLNNCLKIVAEKCKGKKPKIGQKRKMMQETVQEYFLQPGYEEVVVPDDCCDGPPTKQARPRGTNKRSNGQSGAVRSREKKQRVHDHASNGFSGGSSGGFVLLYCQG